MKSYTTGIRELSEQNRKERKNGPYKASSPIKNRISHHSRSHQIPCEAVSLQRRSIFNQEVRGRRSAAEVRATKKRVSMQGGGQCGLHTCCL